MRVYLGLSLRKVWESRKLNISMRLCYKMDVEIANRHHWLIGSLAR